MSGSKLVLVAHVSGHVRDRFAAALALAHHDTAVADSASAVRSHVAGSGRRPDLVLIDLALVTDEHDLLADLVSPPLGLRVGVFAGSVRSAVRAAALAAHAVFYVDEHAAPAQIMPALAPHLFPDSFNRRGGERIDLAVPVAVQVGAQISQAVSVDLSPHGMAIRTMEPLRAGTTARLRFTLPGGVDVDVTAHVVWTDARTGMGVEFERMSAQDQRAIDALLAGPRFGG